jgi:hypothetical protein
MPGANALGRHTGNGNGFVSLIREACGRAFISQGGHSMSKKLGMLVAALMVSGCMAMAATSWTGTVSDSNCGAKHAVASEAAAKCVAGCITHGAKYVLVSKGKVYSVAPQDKFADFAGKSVKVTGTMEGDSITAESVTAANAHKKMKM